MPPPYEAYQQAGYGHFAYGQMQQPQLGAPAVSSPNVPQTQQNYQSQWQNANISYNYQQQYVPPQQQHNFQFAAQQTPQFQPTAQYQHSSPLQQFAAGQLQDPRQQPQPQQQYWPQSNQGVNRPAQYQPAQRQAQPSHINGQSYLPAQHDLRQPIASSSPIQSHQVNIGQAGYGSANQQRQQHPALSTQQQVPSHPQQQVPSHPQQQASSHVQQAQVDRNPHSQPNLASRPQRQNPLPSPSQHFQAAPNQQRTSSASQQVPRPSPSHQAQSTPNPLRPNSVSSRPQQITPASNQRLPQQQQQQQQQHQSQRTPSQSYGQGRSHQVQQSNGTPQQYLPQQSTQTPQSNSQTLQSPQFTPNSRILTHVEIPAYRPADMASAPKPQNRSAQRRPSNEGDNLSVKHRQPQNHQQQPPVPRPHVAIPKPPESSPLSELVSSQVVPPTPASDVDYQSVLLSLSEEYVNAAHTMSARLCSPHATEEELSQYHKLIATALGCLESLITNYRLRDARKEARVRLRFANLLFEETEDTIATEEFSSKSITFCERNRLTDTKYAMHHLLVRVMHRTNATAAIRSLEKLIQEVETMGLTPWIYAFRFLRVSLSMQSSGTTDTSTVLRHLAALNEHADAHQHIGVQVAASTLDAIVHLQSGDSMAADLASRSLAAARTHQTGPVMDEVPQLRAAIDMLDLACAFMQSTPPDQTTQKIIQFHHSLDARAKNTGWTADGSFSLPLGVRSSGDVEADTGGIFRTTPAGELALAFMWFSRSQLYMVGFMLGGISMMNKNGEDRKSETFLAEGLKLNTPAVDGGLAMSVKATEALAEMQQQIAIAIKLLQIFAYCGRAGWPAALKAIDTLHAELANIPHYRDAYTTCSLLYLAGMCKQALGDEVGALRLYQSPELSLQPNPHKAETAVRDIQALAALNGVSIMRLRSHDPAIPEKVLADLGPYCENNHNKAIASTWHILRAHDPDPSTSIIKIKQCIQAALRPAQAIKNVRIMAIIMNTMTAQFFDGIMGKQALQSASAGRSLARRSQDSLWVSVGDGIYRDSLVRSGDMARAVQAEKEVEDVLAKMPAGVKSKLSL